MTHVDFLCRTFRRRARWLAAALLVGCLPGAMLPGAAPPGQYSRGVLIRLEGPITPMLEQYLYRKLETARSEGADLVILEIDSPGGFLQESLNIAGRMRDLEGSHTVAYIPRQALSGAAMVALGCDEILMDRGAVIGDAGPIYQGEDALFRHAPEKIRSDLARRMRDLAEAKGRPPAIAEAMVDMDLVVYEVEDTQTGRRTFMSEHEIQAEENPGRWKKVRQVIESQKGRFLEVNGRRAVELKLAQGIASGREDLRDRYGLRGKLLVLKPSGVDTTVYVLNLPVVTGVLFVIGLVALYVEFSAPGIGLGGLVAVLCFALFFWSRFLGGTAGWLEVVLFVCGVAFLLVELFVLPGFGVAGLSGILLLVASLILAGQNFVIPSTGRQLATLTRTLVVVMGSGAVFAVAAYALSSYLGSIPLLNRLTLQPPDSAAMVAAEVDRLGPDDDSGHMLRAFGVQVGQVGIADSPLRPAGKVRFGNEYVDVVTEGLLVDKGRRVRVIKISGNRVVVREIDDVA